MENREPPQMDGMNHHHDPPNTNGMTMMSPPSLPSSHTHMKQMPTMHMTFFWGKNTDILFSGWPGTSSGMYALALLFVFVLCIIVEFLSHSKILKSEDGSGKRFALGLIRTLLHCLRVGIAYLVMLAIMSFNGGVFLAAVLGHALGFFVFGSRVFGNQSSQMKTSDLPQSTC